MCLKIYVKTHFNPQPMKKLALLAAGAIALSSAAFAQDNCCGSESDAAPASCCAAASGKFDVRDFGTYKLHIYLTEDQMGDASFIIEGADSLVTLEQPLFKVNAAAFDKYLASLGKPVAHRISDFHLGNTGDAALLVPQGMTAVFKGPQYGGMMAHFAEQYGDAIVPLPTGETVEVDFNTDLTLADVPFRFLHGASNDFPGADIVIGKDVVYLHFAPAQAHINTLYASTPAGIDARLAELETALATGATLFVVSHGNPATADYVKFLMDYLGKVKSLRASSPDAEAFAAALTAAFPGLPGEAGVADLAKALYAAE